MQAMPPGVYMPDITEGITDPSLLPPPVLRTVTRMKRVAPCPSCKRRCSRATYGTRTLHDMGDTRKDRPVEIRATYSKHRCPACRIYFSASLEDLAPPGSHYTCRVVESAVRLVLEDGLSYRPASWHMWREHRVFVPFATIQNWCEAAAAEKN